MNKKEIQELKAKDFGSILSYKNPDSINRLIQTTAQLNELPQHDDRAELTIDFLENVEPGEQPFIPGFITVCHDKNAGTWGFMPNPEGDPYAEADILIPEEGIQKLIDAYSKIGLTKLAESLTRGEVTVSDLIRNIQLNTTYSVSGDSNHPVNLNDFSDNIKYGKLQLQCTGSATFLKCSLEEVFGKHSAAIQNGYVMPTHGNRINAAGHCQVSFAIEGQLYLLDATGTRRRGRILSAENIINTAGIAISGVGIIGMISRAFFGSAAQAKNRQPLRQNSSVRIRSVQSAPHEITISKEESFQKCKQMFEQQLMGVYGFSSTEQLYDQVASLSSDDPINRAVSAFFTKNTESLKSTLTYIENIKKADDDLLKRVRLSHYKNSEVLDIAQTALQKAVGDV